MFAQTRQVHHEGALEGAVDFLLHRLEIRVLRAFRKLGTEDFLPVRAPLDLLHALTGDQRTRSRGGLMLALRRLVQVVVIEIEWLIVIIDLGQVRVREDLGEQAPAPAGLQLELAGRGAYPAAVPFALVFPLLGVTDTGFGLDVVEPRIFDPFTRGPHVLAGDRAHMAADAFVEIQHHRNLGADFHRLASCAGGGTGSPSSQSTWFILRTITNSSRFVPVVP